MVAVYIVLSVIAWGTDSEEDAHSRFSLPSSAGAWFCPVFESFEEAEAEWPNEEIMEFFINADELTAFKPANA